MGAVWVTWWSGLWAWWEREGRFGGLSTLVSAASSTSIPTLCPPVWSTYAPWLLFSRSLQICQRLSIGNTFMNWLNILGLVLIPSKLSLLQSFKGPHVWFAHIKMTKWRGGLGGCGPGGMGALLGLLHYQHRSLLLSRHPSQLLAQHCSPLMLQDFSLVGLCKFVLSWVFIYLLCLL